MDLTQSSDKLAIPPDSEGSQAVPKMQQYKYLVERRTSLDQPETISVATEENPLNTRYGDEGGYTHAGITGKYIGLEDPRKRRCGLREIYFIILSVIAIDVTRNTRRL